MSGSLTSNFTVPLRAEKTEVLSEDLLQVRASWSTGSGLGVHLKHTDSVSVGEFVSMKLDVDGGWDAEKG